MPSPINKFTPAEEKVLLSLDSIGGWGTVKELAAHSGYSIDWTSISAKSLVDVGVLQRSKLNPAIFSRIGKPLAPPLSDKPISRPEDIKRLARNVAHTTGGNKALDDYLKGNISMLVSLRSVISMADLVGYDVVLVKRK